MAVGTNQDKLTLEELVALFVGDDDSCGYAHAGLAMAICERLSPRNFEQFRGTLYPELETSALDEEIQKIMRVGYFRWKKRAKPKGSLSECA